MSGERFSPKSATFQQCLDMLDEQLHTERYIRARLLQLLFTQDAAVAVRAAEMYLSLGSENLENSLAALPISVLKKSREKVVYELERIASGETDD